MPASVPGTQLPSCHLACAQGWPDGDACAKGPGYALEIWVPATPHSHGGCVPLARVPPEPRARVPPAFPSVSHATPLSPCQLRLRWLWGKGLPSAPLCLPVPRPASLPACWGSWDQCPPSSPCKSINLLGKHGQERGGGLSVCA